ncbi:MAG: DUF115 domain-containing protein [Richelia sp. SL_2_1]|nr:DUF115 domain-containing protein [Richelia sp. SM1_7_0]NJO31641.1 DUF115 domain-containing protein [Richelia sp. SL_2_1]
MLRTDDPLLHQKPTINPYRNAAFEVWNRLKWDLQPQSWINRRKINNWKNKYSGNKAVIICNGPSLLKTDLSLLNETFTFGLNKINLLFDKSSFRPSCIVSMNRFVIEQNAEFYNQTEIPLFLDSYAVKFVKPRKKVQYLHSSGQKKFAKDCSMSVNQGGTVTFVAMQLAFHMGFDKVALVGCDHNFTAKGAANLVVVSQEKDNDHFDPNYFSGGVKWNLPDIFESEVSYSLAKEIYEIERRSIVNATEGGRLEIFSRMNIKDFVEN